VVAHVRTSGLEVDPLPQVYWSYRQWTQDRMVLAVRSETESTTLVAPVIRAIRSVDPDQSVYDVRSMAQIVDRSQAQRRLATLLMIGFSGLALLLAAVGIYGVVAYGVTQRLREFGIRVALGATPRAVIRLVVRQGTSMTIAGSVVGLVLAIGAAGLMSHLVYGVAPRDVASLLGATAVLMLVGGVASYVPARRAAGVDPAVTLRAE
jgi:ABC-type antimicrobial peptide transport system permease subunit